MSAPTEAGSIQRITVFGEHHRINHDVRRLVLCQLPATVFMHSGEDSMPILTASGTMSSNTRVNLLLDHPRTDVLNVDHACGVFRYD